MYGRNASDSPRTGVSSLEGVVRLLIEKLPEGVYLATSDDVQGLVAQGPTINETIEIARDVARRIFEAQKECNGGPESP